MVIDSDIIGVAKTDYMTSAKNGNQLAIDNIVLDDVSLGILLHDLGGFRRRRVLFAAGLASKPMVITLPDHRLTTAIIVESRDLVEDIKIIARARYHRYFNLLEGAGAGIVVDEERHVGRRLSEYIVATAANSESEDVQKKEKPRDERVTQLFSDIASQLSDDSD